jgi:hypothetical protein
MTFIILFISAIAGVVFRFSLEWGTSNSFSLKESWKQIVVSAAIMIPFAVAATMLNLTHWAFWFVLAAGGFLTKYIVEKALKIKG